MKPIIIFATFKTKPESADFVATELNKLAAACRNEEGCLRYQPHRDIKQPDTFYLHESWADKELLGRHGAAEPLRLFRAAVADHIVATEVKYARELNAD